MCSSVVERCPDKTEVEGPIPSTLTCNFVLLEVLQAPVGQEVIPVITQTKEEKPTIECFYSFDTYWFCL